MNHYRMGVSTASQNQLKRRMTGRYLRQIQPGFDFEHEALCGMFSLCFLPGDRTGSFLGKRFIPVGRSVAVVLSYGYGRRKHRPSMPYRGFRSEAFADGSVMYGAEERCAFLLDAAYCPSTKARRQVLNPLKSPSLCELMFRMDRACRNRIGRSYQLPVLPEFPRIMLGFAPSKPPAFEDTPALREIAAAQLQVPVNHLGHNGELILERLLRDVWEQQLLQPATGGNTTGLLLVDAELCSQTIGVLRMFEDFSNLLGTDTWNPAREVTPVHAANPSQEVLKEFGLDNRSDLGEIVTAEMADSLETAIRKRLGSMSTLFTQAEIYDGIVQPEQPLTAWHDALPKLRARMTPEMSACTTDEDLLRAAEDPYKPLYASGAPRVQVVYRRSACDQNAFEFSPNVLGRKIEANLWADRARPRSSSVSRARPLVASV